MGMSIAEQLIHSTVRIEALDANGMPSSGTGFFFNFQAGPTSFLPAIVTNKHVVRGRSRGFFHLTLDKGGRQPDLGRHERIELIDFASCWLEHPDPEVDLAMVLVGGVVNQLKQLGKTPYYVSLDKELIPTPAKLAELSAIEDVLMIGYPNGLWDAKNNLPLIRRGITSTPPAIDYNDRPDFVIDAACFPGSSGSPILVMNEGFIKHRNGDISIGESRVMFLGVLYAGPHTTAAGTIVARPVPTAMRPVPMVNVMLNLGFCVKSAKILDFETMLQARGLLPPAPKLLAANDSAA